jgi:hypothetical protein
MTRVTLHTGLYPQTARNFQRDAAGPEEGPEASEVSIEDLEALEVYIEEEGWLHTLVRAAVERVAVDQVSKSALCAI